LLSLLANVSIEILISWTPLTKPLYNQLQDQVRNLQEAAAAAATAAEAAAEAPPAPVVQHANAAPVFTLAPALTNTAAFVDLTSSNGIKYFNRATEPLTKYPFDFADPSDLQVFLDLVLKKSQIWGWNPIFDIPVTNVITAVTTYHNLLEEYGLIPLASVCAQAQTYYATPTKRAQDSFMLCQSLLSSLTLGFLKLITADANEYHMPSIVARDGPVPSGPLLLKLIIAQAHVDSRATVSHIHHSLGKLDKKMIKLDSDIEVFNFYVKAQVKHVSARGEASSDLLVNLFKGYKVANEVEFEDFIKRKQNAYKEGEENTSPNSLMADSLVKYKARKLVNKWSAPTKEQGQILALTAQIEKLTSSRKQKQQQQPSRTSPSSGNQCGSGRPGKWSWKDTLPKEGKPTTKEFEGKHYHVDCKYHPKQWVCHTTTECSKNPASIGASPPGVAADSSSKGPDKRQLKAAKLAAAIYPSVSAPSWCLLQ
jgi:hypothetical protein